MLLTVNHAAFSYDSSHMILKNITFQLDKKSFVGILGPYTSKMHQPDLPAQRRAYIPCRK